MSAYLQHFIIAVDSYFENANANIFNTDAPGLMMGLCLNEPTVNKKYHKSKNAFNTPNIPNIIVSPSWA